MKKLLAKHSHILHKIGLGLSFICAIHCLAMPFLLVAMPYIGSYFFSHEMEIALILSSLIIGILVLVKDIRIHGNKLPLVMLSISAILSLISYATHLHLFLTFGSVLMAAAYFLNWRYHRNICSSVK